jgi:hypothetical protein
MKTKEELGIKIVKEWPLGHQSSFMKTLDVTLAKLEEFLGVEILRYAGEKYSLDVILKFRGYYFMVYTLWDSPRLGSCIKGEKLSESYKETAKGLIEELGKL